MKSGQYHLLENKEDKIASPDIIIPAPLNSLERQSDLNEFMNGIMRADLGYLTRTFNHASLGKKVNDVLIKNLHTYPKEDLTREQSDSVFVSLAENEFIIESLLDEEGHLQPFLSKNFPSTIYSSLGTCLTQLYALAFQAIHDEKGEFQPWLQEYIGRDRLSANKNISKETIRDYLIISAMQCMGGGFIGDNNEKTYPNLGSLIGKIISVQNNVIKDCRIALNNLKDAIEKKPSNSFLQQAAKTVYDASESALTSLLSQGTHIGQIPLLTKAAKKATDVVKEPSAKTLMELGKVASEAPGSSKPLRLLFGTLFVLGGIAAIGLGIAGTPFTGGLSLAGVVTIGASTLSYIAGSLGAVTGVSLWYSGKQKGYSQTLSTFAKQAEKKEEQKSLPEDQEPLLGFGR